LPSGSTLMVVTLPLPSAGISPNAIFLKQLCGCRYKVIKDYYYYYYYSPLAMALSMVAEMLQVG
jgi:hypothetical protein